jgi:integrase
LEIWIQGKRRDFNLGTNYQHAKEMALALQNAFRNRVQAEHFLRTLQETGVLGAQTGIASNVEWGDALERVFEQMNASGSRPRTITIIKNALKNFERIIKPKLVSDFNKANADLFIKERSQEACRYKVKQKRVSSTTVNQECRSLRSFGKRLLRMGLIGENPLTNADYPKPEKELPNPIQISDLQKILSDSSPPLARCIKIIAGLGLRVSEFVNAKWSEVDHLNKVFFVRSSDEWKIKTHSERGIPISKDVIAVLGRAAGANDFVAGLNSKGNPVTVDWLEKAFKKTVERAGLRGVKINHLRDTFGTSLAMAGFQAHEVAARMGHSNIFTAIKYIKLADLLKNKKKTPKLW